MPDHRIFNERPESQDRALKVIEKLGYTFISRSEAEKKRGFLNHVLFLLIYPQSYYEIHPS